MPLKNRVNPFGHIVASAARGSLMGNRGILHDEHGNIHKTHAHQNWVACALAFNGNKRTLMAPHSYTELFFLDEATALAAGHRPCATCRRDRYRAFTQLWLQVHGAPPEGTPLPKAIDRALHVARIERNQKVTSPAVFEELPNGVMISKEDHAILKWNGVGHLWSFEGYGLIPVPISGPVRVLTPKPLIALLHAGYRPEIHPSLPG
ncbi:hypothetical protein LZA78_02860 [Sinirhodobacter sp. WL0062]|uniref:Ada DNA repair metal-binding domain-containing protein n=1 Tax=Rhodobacter flavimaris TaxID=2907145 RepID=A0ABS8YT23_9RHOB|nr:hypothetical protein [Sinirhodobacter sp. WL0062]MCE5972430.1 hypothetical protein [Sinirhodobacter sp. WL0062]